MIGIREENAETTLSNETEDSENMGFNSTAKNLVVYFSMPETTEPENMSREEGLSTVVIDGEVLGNTQYVAYIIAENTGADIFRIEPVTPYPLDPSELEDIAQKEQSENFRPSTTPHHSAARFMPHILQKCGETCH